MSQSSRVSHHRGLGKENIPITGGVMMIISWLIWFKWWSSWVMISVLAYGVIGFVDDGMKVIRRIGMTVLSKVFWQIVCALVIAIGMWIYGYTNLFIPFFGWVNFGIFIIPLALFVIPASVNSANLTDGVDGLLITQALPAAITLSLISGIGYAEVAALSGAGVAFWIFNRHPARVFMGDCGAFVLGAWLGVFALASGYVWALPFCAPVLILESISTMIQIVAVRKFGVKIFKMAPFHHHLEIIGWSERKIVFVMTSLTLIGCACCIMIFGIKG